MNDGDRKGVERKGVNVKNGDDGVSVMSGGGDGVSMKNGGDGVSVMNGGDDGVSVISGGGDGVSMKNGGDGVSVMSGGDGVSVMSGGGDGVSMKNGGDGVSVMSGGDGVSVMSGGDGVSVMSGGGDGVSVISGGGDGVSMKNGGDGVSVMSGGDGVSVMSGGGDGVVVVDNCINAKPPQPPSHLPPSLERVRKLVATSTPPSLHFYHLSLQDRQQLRMVFDKHCVKVVIHFAGLKAVGESVKRPLDYYANNLTSTITLLQVMNEVGCRVLVFSSSSTVYGPATYFPTDEDHPTGPAITNPYGRTKYFCEQVMKDVAAQDKRWSVVVLRYFNPVGAHSSGLLGDDPVTGRPVNLLPSLAHVAAGRKKVFHIFGEDWDTPDGTCIRDFMHVMDLAEGHVAALEHAHTHTGASVFNLGRGEGVSVRQMIQAFERACGCSLPCEVVCRRAGDVRRTTCSGDRAKAVLGWRPYRTLDDMCRDSWLFQVNNPHGY
ncbi:hypothetical protein Pmani_014876 [Petrolisthes manimaculis]|uniref:UDP-N-acetylglucosamine 4-epimerase n=1 Tax=Petrolisthes manimaculis TaxID=1843537 RepID=A0AAE1PS24_9EUCA|nr:hypothetical protein Pmani_014876 [Petrolisthes manimaculis]